MKDTQSVFLSQLLQPKPTSAPLSMGAKITTWFDFRPAAFALTFLLLAACSPAAKEHRNTGIPAIPEGEAAVRGPADAPVTIVEFSEFECPYCARVQPTLAELDAAYPGKLRFVFKHRPLPNHKNAAPAAIASMAAQNQGKFWEYREALFKNQQTLTGADLARLAEQLGLDLEKFNTDVSDPLAKVRLSADDSLAIKLGVTGTPTFAINGRVLTGAQPFEKFRTLIDEELAKADTMAAEGIPAERISAVLTEMNRKHAAEQAAKAPRKTPEKQEDPSALFAVGYQSHHLSVGGSEAESLVTMVIFTDYQCPFCERLEHVLKSLMEKYGKDLRIVFRNNPLPFHKDAGPAASAVLAAVDQGKGWDFHLKVMSNQKALDPADLDHAAMAVGLDIRLFRMSLHQNRYEEILKKDIEDAQTVGARGTPTSFINGKKVVGARPVDVFVEVIDAELQRARSRATARGLSGRALYDSLTTVP